MLDGAGGARARAVIRSWPGHAPTPLVDLPGAAARAGVARVLYKDEAGRFGLGSFKALGGAYAVAELLRERVAAATGEDVAMDDLLAGRYRAATRSVTVTCATDGNHGRSVAWGARLFGCACVIFIHATVSEGRKAAIERFGATVRRTAGNYDDSVRVAGETARREGWLVVSDTSYPGYTDVPRWVMQGYTTMADEALAALPAAGRPTHLFLQTGVGGMAAAVAARFWQEAGAARPRVVLADPARADCWWQSLRAGERVAVGGALDTMMAGLACGECSLLAWDVLRQGADAVIRVGDAAAEDCMRGLADGAWGPKLVAGESAVAGLAALLDAAGDPAAREAIGLGPEARVLLLGTEGDTDPEVYAAIVGRSGDAVRAEAP